MSDAFADVSRYLLFPDARFFSPFCACIFFGALLGDIITQFMRFHAVSCNFLRSGFP